MNEQLKDPVRAQITMALIRIKNYAAAIGDIETVTAIEGQDSGKASIDAITDAVLSLLKPKTLSLKKSA